jgi:hypothetical protein
MERKMVYKKLLFVVLMVALLIPVASYAQEDTSNELFIGVITDFPDEFVGLAIDGDTATFYICDGNAAEGTVSIAQWFIGDVVDNLIDITAPNGNRVEITLAGETASGILTLSDGSSQSFAVALARDDAALFRSEFTIGEDSYVGGWLVLEDGSVRGAIFKAGSQELTPASFSGGNQVFQIDPIDLPAR